MRHAARIAIPIVLIAAIAAVLWWRASVRNDRARAAEPARSLAAALASGDRAAIRQLVVTPDFLAAKSPDERDQLLLDLLASEISPGGLTILQESGQFGPLSEVFPAEADSWARAFSVSPDECVAFRMENGDNPAELVLHRGANGYRVLRCNNVRQLARPPPSP